MIPAELIRKKRFRGTLSESEIEFFISGYATGKIPDYQMAAMAMAICFSGMTDVETSQLTRAMRDSGVVLDFSQYAPNVVDKHSTGGVGDKTSLILAPLVAAAGVKVPMIAGRGLGHTGGTLDKLESIPGFDVVLSLETLRQNVKEHGFSIIGQTAEICPADKKLYALRDVTGTVDSLPLICGSIMSKKLAEGLSALVLDVKFGTGAFMKTQKDAKELATSLMRIGKNNGVETNALLTSMEQPLGAFIGNALEVEECIRIMKNETLDRDGEDFFADTRDLTLELAGEMIYAGKKAETPEAGLAKAKEILESGEAFRWFEKMIEFQGGDLSKFTFEAEEKKEFLADSDGVVSAMNVEAIGLAALQLGAGRKTSSDEIDNLAGIEMHKKVGSKVKKGEPLCSLYFSKGRDLNSSEEYLMKSFEISKSDNVKRQPLVAEILR